MSCMPWQSIHSFSWPAGLADFEALAPPEMRCDCGLVKKGGLDIVQKAIAERDAALAKYEALKAACLAPACPLEPRMEHSHICILCMAEVEPDQPDLHDRDCALFEEPTP